MQVTNKGVCKECQLSFNAIQAGWWPLDILHEHDDHSLTDLYHRLNAQRMKAKEVEDFESWVARVHQAIKRKEL